MKRPRKPTISLQPKTANIVQLELDESALSELIAGRGEILPSLPNTRKFMRLFKRIICADISEFESYMPSHAVGLSASP